MHPKTRGIRGLRILLVEDDYYIVDDMARSFRADGAEILGPAASVADALRLLAGPSPPDGAVLDLNLQGEMAFGLAAALQDRGVPFVFATGYCAATIPPRFSAVRHCLKPVEPRALAEALFP